MRCVEQSATKKEEVCNGRFLGFVQRVEREVELIPILFEVPLRKKGRNIKVAKIDQL